MSRWIQNFESKSIQLGKDLADLAKNYRNHKWKLDGDKNRSRKEVYSHIETTLTNNELELLYIINGQLLKTKDKHILCASSIPSIKNLHKELSNTASISETVHKFIPTKASDIKNLLKKLPKTQENQLFDIVCACLCSYRPGYDEENIREYLFNILVVFSRLKYGGTAIIRMDIPYTYILLSFIMATNLRFGSVDLLRVPFGSKANPKIYLVCRNYNKPCPASVFDEYLSRVENINQYQLYDTNLIENYMTSTQKHTVVDIIGSTSKYIEQVLQKRPTSPQFSFANHIVGREITN